MLEKPEEKEFHKKWESLYVFTGRRSDLTTMISIAVINPMILYVFIGYVAGKRISLPVLYLIIDGVLFLQWGLLGKKDGKRKQTGQFPDRSRLSGSISLVLYHPWDESGPGI